jgi:hypothetical protein
MTKIVNQPNVRFNESKYYIDNQFVLKVLKRKKIKRLTFQQKRKQKYIYRGTRSIHVIFQPTTYRIPKKTTDIFILFRRMPTKLFKYSDNIQLTYTQAGKKRIKADDIEETPLEIPKKTLRTTREWIDIHEAQQIAKAQQRMMIRKAIKTGKPIMEAVKPRRTTDQPVAHDVKGLETPDYLNKRINVPLEAIQRLAEVNEEELEDIQGEIQSFLVDYINPFPLGVPNLFIVWIIMCCRVPPGNSTKIQNWRRIAANDLEERQAELLHILGAKVKEESLLKFSKYVYDICIFLKIKRIKQESDIPKLRDMICELYTNLIERQYPENFFKDFFIPTLKYITNFVDIGEGFTKDQVEATGSLVSRQWVENNIDALYSPDFEFMLERNEAEYHKDFTYFETMCEDFISYLDELMEAAVRNGVQLRGRTIYR